MGKKYLYLFILDAIVQDETAALGGPLPLPRSDQKSQSPKFTLNLTFDRSCVTGHTDLSGSRQLYLRM